MLEESGQCDVEVLQVSGQHDSHVIEEPSGQPDCDLSCDWESNLESECGDGSGEPEEECVPHDFNEKEEDSAQVMQLKMAEYTSSLSMAPLSPSSTQPESLSAPKQQEPNLKDPLPCCQKSPFLPSSPLLQEPHIPASYQPPLLSASAPLLQEAHCTLSPSSQPAVISSSMPPHALSISIPPHTLSPSSQPAVISSSMPPHTLSISIPPHTLSPSSQPAVISSSLPPYILPPSSLPPLLSAASLPHQESHSLSSLTCQQPPILSPSSPQPPEPHPTLPSRVMPHSQPQVHQPWSISSLLSEPDDNHVPISITCTSTNTRTRLTAGANVMETGRVVEGKGVTFAGQESRSGSVQRPFVRHRINMEEDHHELSKTTPQACTTQALASQVQASACSFSYGHSLPVSAELRQTSFNTFYPQTSSLPQTDVSHCRTYTGLPQSSSSLAQHEVAHNHQQYAHSQQHQATHGSAIVQPWIDQSHRQQSGNAHYCQQQHGNTGSMSRMSSREIVENDQIRQVGECNRPWSSRVSHSGQYTHNHPFHFPPPPPFLQPSLVQQRLLDNPHSHLPHQHHNHHSYPHSYYHQQSQQLQSFEPWPHYPSLTVNKTTSSFQETSPQAAAGTSWHCRHPHCRNEHRQHHSTTPYMQHIMSCDSMTTHPYPSVWRPYSEANRSTGFCVSDSLTQSASSRHHPLHIDHTSPGPSQHAHQLGSTPHPLQIEPTPHPLQIEPSRPTSRIESFFVDRLLDDM